MKIIFFDIEANGYQQVHSRETLQIGAIKCDYDTGETEYFDEMIIPTRYKKVTSHCFNITGIDNRTVMKNGKAFEDVINKFIEFAKDSILISWDEYDYVQLNADCHRLNMESVFSNKNNIKYINFQKVFQLKHGIKKKPSLIKALSDYELKFNDFNIHSAIVDSLNLKEIFDTTNSIDTINRIVGFEKTLKIIHLTEQGTTLRYEDKGEMVELGLEERHKNKKLDENFLNLIKNSVIKVLDEKTAENLIHLLNKNNIWEDVYIVNY